MRTSESLVKLAPALVAAQAEMPNVPKETVGQVGSQKRNYADLATTVDTVRPVLASHRLAYIQGASDGSAGFVTITTRLLHESGEWIEDALSMPCGNTPQTVGSATTYARRYSLMAILGLAPEDDDGAAASAAPRRAAPKRQDDDQPRGTASDAQIQKMIIGFNELAIKERPARLAYMSAVVGRDVESSKALSKAEASAVIEQLELDKRSNPESGPS